MPSRAREWPRTDNQGSDFENSRDSDHNPVWERLATTFALCTNDPDMRYFPHNVTDLSLSQLIDFDCNDSFARAAYPNETCVPMQAPLNPPTLVEILIRRK